MVSIQTRAHIGADGRLCLDVPTELRGTEVEVVLILEPQRSEGGRDAPPGKSTGWPAGFFEQTAGKWQGQPLVRDPQGDYEVRDELE